MKIQTGETLAPGTQNWTWPQREQLGQQYLRELAEAFLNWHDGQDTWYKNHYAEVVGEMRLSLENDGYVYAKGKLLAPEADVLDVTETAAVLELLYSELGLNNKDVALHCLKLSQDHWLSGKWDDCIANARRFLECVLQEIAAAHCLAKSGVAMPTKSYERPVEVRDYLERVGLLETKEKKALAEVYGLLSNTGSHPYGAQAHQARIFRQV